MQECAQLLYIPDEDFASHCTINELLGTQLSRYEVFAVFLLIDTVQLQYFPVPHQI